MTSTAERFPKGIPGAYFDDVVDELDPGALTQLVGDGALSALRLLACDGDGPKPEALAAMVDRSKAISSPEHLQLLLEVLPSHKLEELASRLGASPTDPQTLAIAGSEDAATSITAGFFGFTLDTAAQPAKPPQVTDARAAYGLFEHQRAACHAAVKKLEGSRDPQPAALLHMPTGSGKTRTASHVVSRHLLSRTRGVVVWYGHTKELLEQAADELTRAWSTLGDRDIPVVRLWGDTPTIGEITDGIVVAGIQKMWALHQSDPDQFSRIAEHCTLTVVDEAHIGLAPTYRSVMDMTRRKPDVGMLGLTATPGRTWNDPEKDAGLAAMYGGNKITLDVVGYDNPVEYLMDEGFLARPTFEVLDLDANAYTVSAVPAVDIGGADDDTSAEEERASSAPYLAGVVRAVERLAADGHHRVIVFAASVAHAVTVASLLRVRGIGADAVTGETPKGRREGAISRFKQSGGARALVNFGVLTTGFDAPATSAAVIARPTRSLVLYSQMVGRSIRGTRAGGNDTARILTVVDPDLPGFGSVAAAFTNWEDVW